MRHGFLLIDKPKGPTSHDVVHTVRKRLPERDVGHIGTLDPAATGLMVLAVGSKALKVIEFFNGLHKEYLAEVTFGAVSTTYDGEGVIEPYPIKPGVPEPDHIAVRRMIDDRFVGNVSQRPPAHSAVHIGGKRAYELARKGEAVEMPERAVRIDSCTIVSYEYPMATLRVACGSGTYIRSLAHDLGETLRVGAYLSALRRTKVGDWSVEDAVQMDDVAWTDVQPLKEVLKHLPAVEITAAEMEDVKHGRSIAKAIETDTFAWFEGLPVAVLTNAGGRVRPRKVL